MAGNSLQLNSPVEAIVAVGLVKSLSRQFRRRSHLKSLLKCSILTQEFFPCSWIADTTYELVTRRAAQELTKITSGSQMS